MIPFGPQLIGQTEKALGALLRSALADHDLSEPEWVTLRLTEQFDNTGSLTEFISGNAHFPQPHALLAGLIERELIEADQLTERGAHTVATIKGQITELTTPLWESLDPDDTAAAQRVLNIVLEQARSILA